MRALEDEPRQRRVLHPRAAVGDDLAGEVEAEVAVLAQAREHRSTLAIHLRPRAAGPRAVARRRGRWAEATRAAARRAAANRRSTSICPDDDGWTCTSTGSPTWTADSDAAWPSRTTSIT